MLMIKLPTPSCLDQTSVEMTKRYEKPLIRLLLNTFSLCLFKATASEDVDDKRNNFKKPSLASSCANQCCICS